MRMTKHLLTGVATLALIFAVAACGNSDTRGASTQDGAGTRPAPSKVKIAALMPLEIVPAEKVAAIAGGKVIFGMMPSPTITLYRDAKYSIKLPNGYYEDFYIRFETAEIQKGELKDRFWREKKKERVRGLWDEAYFFPGSSPNDTATIFLIRRQGDVGLKISTANVNRHSDDPRDDKATLIAIAKVAVSNLK